MDEHPQPKTPDTREADALAEKKGMGVFLEVVKLSLIALLVITPIRFFIAQPFIVSGASMDPTFKTREYLVIDKVSPRFQELQRGDVLIFRYPLDPDVFFVKRVIGLPGDVLKVTGDTVALLSKDGNSFETLQEPYVAHGATTTNSLLPTQTYTVTLADDELYMMGDNRQYSSDSRVWGALKKKYIIGRAVARILPVSRFEWLPGKYSFPE